MNREDLIASEVEKLNTLAKSYVLQLENPLSQIRNEKTKLWLNQQDQYRLLTLKTWESKYKLDTRTILQILLPFWEKFVQRRSRKMKTQGLNVRVSTLTGKKSEQILVEAIKSIYPNGENKLLWSSNQKELIIQRYLKKLEKKRDDGVRSHNDPSSMYTTDGRVKTLLDFSTPDAFVKYYRKWTKKEQLAREKIESEMKLRKYRGNPFLLELL